jgi:hypothetical protein
MTATATATKITPSQTPKAKAARAARKPVATNPAATAEASVLNGVSNAKPVGRTSTRKPAPVTTSQKPGTTAPLKGLAKVNADRKAAKEAAAKAAPAKAKGKAAPKAAPKPAPDAKTRIRDGKRALALMVVQAVAEMIETADPSALLDVGGKAEARIIASSWIHHLPADHAAWVQLLPAPDRSDWR